MIPGRTRSRSWASAGHISTSVGSAGRGPTTLISPRSTFQNCGSSSSESLRRYRPIGVTRGSLRILNSAPSLSFWCHQLGLARLGVDHHRAQLDDLELPAVATDPDLTEEDRTGRRQPVRDRGDGDDRDGDDQCHDRDRDVEHPLGRGSPSVADDRLDVDEGAAAEVLGADPGDVDVAQARRQCDVVPAIGEAAGHRVDERVRHRRQRDHDADRVGVGDDLLEIVVRAEHRDATALAEIGVADETDDVVAEIGVALERVQEPDRVSVGADDDDSAVDATGPAQVEEHPAGDATLDDQRSADAEEQHDRPRGGTAPCTARRRRSR